MRTTFGIPVSHQYWEQLRQVVHQFFFEGRILIPMRSVYISYQFISAAYAVDTQPSWRSSRFQVAAALVGQLCQNRLEFGQRLQAADAGVEGLDKSLVPSGNAPWLAHQSSNYMSLYVRLSKLLVWGKDINIIWKGPIANHSPVTIYISLLSLVWRGGIANTKPN